MEQTFVDPVIHSRRIERFNVSAFGLVMLIVLGAVWIRWYVGEREAAALRLSLMMSSIVVASFFVGYYMMKHSRRLLMDGVWFLTSETGFQSVTLAGVYESDWSEVLEVRIGMRPSATKTPDVWIRTADGNVGAFMRWTPKSPALPEPIVLSGGRRFIAPDGRKITLTPDTSDLVAAISKRVPEEKIKRGVITSL